MRVFSAVLLVLCGVVFVTSPAGLLAKLTPGWMNGTFWAVVILVYYLLATLLPIDKLIGKLYPVFGVLLLVMAGAVIGGILFSGGKYAIPELRLENLHPAGTPVWPYMFITVACGAISGFLQLGTMDGDEFVSDETAVEPDLPMTDEEVKEVFFHPKKIAKYISEHTES